MWEVCPEVMPVFQKLNKPTVIKDANFFIALYNKHSALDKVGEARMDSFAHIHGEQLTKCSCETQRQRQCKCHHFSIKYTYLCAFELTTYASKEILNRGISKLSVTHNTSKYPFNIPSEADIRAQFCTCMIAAHFSIQYMHELSYETNGHIA